MKRILVSAVAAMLLAAGSAGAQEAPPPPPPPSAAPPPDLSRIGELLSQSAENADDRRHANVVIGVASAIVFLPTGIALETRASDEVARTVGTGLIAGAGGSLVVAAFSLFPSPVERLHERFEQRRAGGMPAAQLLQLTESEWSLAARDAAKHRQTYGTIEAIAGGVVALAGAVILLAPKFGSSQDVQYRIGSLCAGAGLPFFTLGMHQLLQKSAEEQGWEAYRAGMPAPAAAASTPGVFTF